MLVAQLLTFMLTSVFHVQCIDLEDDYSSSRHRFIKRSLNSKGCGLRGNVGIEDDEQLETTTDDFIGKIVGGSDSIYKWPWMATISHDGLHSCGGSVLDNKHVITAAHCFDGDNDPEHITVTVEQMELGEGMSFKVQKIEVHKEYTKAPFFYNDIALVVLQDPLPAHIIPICLPDNDKIGDKETLTITGFGTLEEGGEVSKLLQEVHGIPYINSEKCDSIMQEILGKKSEITEKQFCTGDEKGGHGSCQGDSGGPVVHREKDRSWTLAGLVSYSIGCVRPGIPTVHTRLYAYRDWIKEHMAA